MALVQICRVWHRKHQRPVGSCDERGLGERCALQINPRVPQAHCYACFPCCVSARDGHCSGLKHDWMLEYRPLKSKVASRQWPERCCLLKPCITEFGVLAELGTYEPGVPAELDILEHRVPAELGTLERRVPAQLGILEHRVPAELGPLEPGVPAQLSILERRLPELGTEEPRVPAELGTLEPRIPAE